MAGKIVFVDESRTAAGNGRGDEASDAYRVAVETPGLLVLRRANGADGAAGQVLLAGEIVADSTVLEIVNLIASSRWVGTLHIYGPDSHRALGFAHGVLRHARSDHPEDRLDKVLCRSKVVSPADVEAVMREMHPDQRLGELLVARGLIERRQLFDQLQRQMEQVLLSSVLENRGSFVFLVHEHEPPPSATAHIPVQQLILTAAERVDRYAGFLRLIPDLDHRPEVAAGVEVARLDPRSRLVAGYCDGQRSLRQIASETWLGRFETLETVDRLLRRGCLRLLPPSRSTRRAVSDLVAPFNELLRDVLDTLARSGDGRPLHGELAAWAETSEDGEPLRGCLGPDGQVEPAALATAIGEPISDMRLDGVRHALYELTSYALFTAALRLPRPTERELAGRVNERLSRLGS